MIADWDILSTVTQSRIHFCRLLP